MISDVRVTNFQSLADVTVPLGRFTVIVGPSNVGKSALTRALRMAVSNRRGSDFIRAGQAVCTVQLSTDRGTLHLQRHRTKADENRYTIIPTDGEQRSFTKLGGTVPEEVSQFIGIPAADPINFAGQHDGPYLITSSTSAGEVARVLGALTNVSAVFNAASEAVRRRNAANATLKTRTADVAALTERAGTFRELPGQLRAITAAEQHLEAARAADRDAAALQNAIEREAVASAALARLDTRRYSLPSIEPARAAVAELETFTAAVRSANAYQQRAAGAASTLEAATEDTAAARAELRTAMGGLARALVAELEPHSTDGTIPTNTAAVVAARYIANALETA